VSAQGATVLLSSHHLSEVEQMCSHVIVMNRGRLVADGTVRELIGATGSVYIEVDDEELARSVLGEMSIVTDMHAQGDGLVVQLRDGRRSDLAFELFARGVKVETLMATQQLEDAFLDLLATDGANAPIGSAT
jgi:ABC-2 type transport system ATP-binding protein